MAATTPTTAPTIVPVLSELLELLELVVAAGAADVVEEDVEDVGVLVIELDRDDVMEDSDEEERVEVEKVEAVLTTVGACEDDDSVVETVVLVVVDPMLELTLEVTKAIVVDASDRTDEAAAAKFGQPPKSQGLKRCC